jgi:hypothetical protein
MVAGFRWLPVALLVGACAGNADQPSPSGVDSTVAAAYCDAIVARDTRCANPPSAGYCDSYRTCIETTLRPDVVPELTTCIQNLPCDQNDAACTTPLSAANTSATFSAFKSACEARLAACQGAFTSETFFCFENELGVASDSFIREAQSCLAQDCNAIRGCMDVASFVHQCKN